MKTFRYRIYPTAKQRRLLESTLDECCWLYNYFLAGRKSAWEERNESVGRDDQLTSLPSLKLARRSLASIHSQVLQNVAIRVDLAFQAFFRRCQNGETPGYPRFRGKERYDSLCYPQYGNGCKLDGNQLFLSKIGTVQGRDLNAARRILSLGLQALGLVPGSLPRSR
jgi:putative transposase